MSYGAGKHYNRLAGRDFSEADRKRIKSAALQRSVKRAILPFIMLLGVFVFLNLGGCSTVENRAHIEIASQPVVYQDAKILRDPPVVHIHPRTEATGLKVLFLPFRVTQVMQNSEMAGYSIAKTFWQTWASMQVFDYMEYVPDAGPFRVDAALRLARAKGADMVVGGYVTNLLSGSTIAQSSLALQLEAYDVSSGMLVWSMGQAAAIPRPESNDYIIFSTRNKMPGDPIYALTQVIASDMGNLMRNWSQQDAIREEQARKAQEEEEAGFTQKVGEFFDGIFD